MFDIGWSELLIIGVVALIVIGPKDLPEMFRTLGRFTAKLRSMSRDFQRAMEAAAKDTGVNDIAKDVKNMASPKNLGLDAVRSAADRFEKWDPLKPARAKARRRPRCGPGRSRRDAGPGCDDDRRQLGPADRASGRTAQPHHQFAGWPSSWRW
jgi:sec-independent protein translocase protein TatB